VMGCLIERGRGILKTEAEVWCLSRLAGKDVQISVWAVRGEKQFVKQRRARKPWWITYLVA
jgi:hypothetical protein